ncbi:sulfite exporter TauE/SafE family protein [Roseomonas sp. NAR14]|uniref:Sulfite exporter TauE/SafE family protein n=1 Tax=Roseomonas acroporae TaxID=2937791 RepID=A0A9X1Y9F4_9PROT|nr:sulfite exporter TauE/SafE family protein [Roseomonas acroporae]MCK8784775.1 sulfite exporter TauE/SafE family protein [Roseomonas acroporae]
MLADCLHDLTALGTGGLATLCGTLFLAGLAGGVTHCAGMCAPFVLVQSAGLAGGPALRRLAGAALLPYHLGRMLGYGLLGALSGGLAGLAASASGLRWPLAFLLALGAATMLLRAAGLSGLPLPVPRLPVARLAAWSRSLHGLTLGLILSALPCGLLYGALAAAAASGSALAGWLSMLCFALGTAPALSAVALLGGAIARRHGQRLRLVGVAVLVLNAVVLGGLAVRVLA